MDIGQIISDVQHEHCVSCPVGKCLITLKNLKEEQERATQAEALPVQKSRSLNEKPVKKSSPRPLAGKRTIENGMRQQILDYLQAHPGSKLIEISAFIGLATNTLSYHIKQLGKKVKHIGYTTNCRWYLADQKPTAVEPDPDPEPEPDQEGTADGKLYCRLCNSPCSSPERLKSHMKLVHGKVAPA